MAEEGEEEDSILVQGARIARSRSERGVWLLSGKVSYLSEYHQIVGYRSAPILWLGILLCLGEVLGFSTPLMPLDLCLL